MPAGRSERYRILRIAGKVVTEAERRNGSPPADGGLCPRPGQRQGRRPRSRGLENITLAYHLRMVGLVESLIANR